MSNWTRSKHWQGEFRNKVRLEAYTDYFGIPHAEAFTSQSTTNVTDWADTITGADQPKWIEYVKAGVNATNFVTGTKTEINSSRYSGTYSYRYKPSPTPPNPPIRELSIDGFPGLGTVTSGSFNNQAYNTALQQFVSHANKRISNFDGGTFIGEIRDTIHLLKSPVSGIKNYLQNYMLGLRNHRKRGMSKRDKLKYASDKWLECSFGIKPLISDIQSGAEAISQIVNNPPRPEHVSGSGFAENVVLETGIATHAHTAGLMYWRDSVLIKDISRAKVYGAVILENAATGRGIRETLGVRPDLFVPTLWELIPYSWLVDYFSNVGNIIEAACFNTARLRWVGATQLTERLTTVRFHGDASDKTADGYISSFVGGGNSTMSTKGIYRFVPATLVPSLEITIPSRWTQWTNMAAVAVQHGRLTPY